MLWRWVSLMPTTIWWFRSFSHSLFIYINTVWLADPSPWDIHSVIFCYFVSGLHPPAPLASLKYAYSPFVLSSFLRFWFFFSSFPFTISIWTSFVSSWLFLMGARMCAVSSVSVSAATRLAYKYEYDTYYVSWYVRWSHLKSSFFSEVHD